MPTRSMTTESDILNLPTTKQLSAAYQYPNPGLGPHFSRKQGIQHRLIALNMANLMITREVSMIAISTSSLTGDMLVLI